MYNKDFYADVDNNIKELLNHPVPELIQKENRRLLAELETKIGQKDPNIDSITGRMAEQIVFNDILCKPSNTFIKAFNDTSDYDHLIISNGKECSFEVKVDLRTQETGNLAFELRCNNKDSGMYITKATYVVYIIPGMKNNKLYFDRIKLLKFLKEHEEKNTYRIAKESGDKARQTDCMLIKYQDVIEWGSDILLKKEQM